MDAFLEYFGGYTIADGVKFVVLLCFLFAIYCKLKSYFNKLHEKEEKMNNILEKYPEWHQQSIEIQQQFTYAISELKKGQEQNAKRLEQIDADNRKRARNRLREQLLQSYRYYTSKEKNSMQAWTEMEADAFWKLFGDYKDVGGNGHIHSVVQPAMRALDVIQMHETEQITELMKSRK